MAAEDTFMTLKDRIKAREDYELVNTALFYKFYPLNDTKRIKDVIEDDSEISAVISAPKTVEDLQSYERYSNSKKETVFIMKDKQNVFLNIQNKHKQGGELPKSLFKNSSKFAVFREKREEGLRTFTSRVYRPKPSARIEFQGSKFFQRYDANLTELEEENETTFKEEDLIQGVLSRNIDDALSDVGEDLLEDNLTQVHIKREEKTGKPF